MQAEERAHSHARRRVTIASPPTLHTYTACADTRHCMRGEATQQHTKRIVAAGTHVVLQSRCSTAIHHTLLSHVVAKPPSARRQLPMPLGHCTHIAAPHHRQRG